MGLADLGPSIAPRCGASSNKLACCLERVDFNRLSRRSSDLPQGRRQASQRRLIMKRSRYRYWRWAPPACCKAWRDKLWALWGSNGFLWKCVQDSRDKRSWRSAELEPKCDGGAQGDAPWGVLPAGGWMCREARCSSARWPRRNNRPKSATIWRVARSRGVWRHFFTACATWGRPGEGQQGPGPGGLDSFGRCKE
jgi:hypothetical protein